MEIKVINVDLEYNKGILFIRLKGDVSHYIAHQINSKLIPKILEQRIKYIVFNLYEITNIDMFGIDALLNVKCAVKTNKGKICLCEVSKNIEYKIKKLRINKASDELKAFDLMGEI